MKDFLAKTLFNRLSTPVLQWVFRGALVLFVLNLFIPDALPFLDEIAIGWFVIETLRTLRSRKGAVRDVDADEVLRKGTSGDV